MSNRMKSSRMPAMIRRIKSSLPQPTNRHGLATAQWACNTRRLSPFFYLTGMGTKGPIGGVYFFFLFICVVICFFRDLNVPHREEKKKRKRTERFKSVPHNNKKEEKKNMRRQKLLKWQHNCFFFTCLELTFPQRFVRLLVLGFFFEFRSSSFHLSQKKKNWPIKIKQFFNSNYGN